MSETTTASLETELTRFFAAGRLRASDYGPHYVALWESLETASSGGKRVRPALVLAAYAGFDGRNGDLVTPVAMSFELLHTAFLIHDDVIDRDLSRRGTPNVAGRFRDRAGVHGVGADQADVWATTAAILAGDLALSEAHRALATLPVETDIRGRLLDLLDRSVFVSAAGELADVTNSASALPLGVEEILATLEQKTAVYSFEAPLQAGAILAGAPLDAVDVLGRFGRLVGVAFQLVDDILGVFGDESVTGKSTLTDLREGKQTALVAHAATTPSWPSISPYIGNAELTEDEAAVVRGALDACGSLRETKALACDHANMAISLLDTGVIPAGLRLALADLAETAVNRCR